MLGHHKRGAETQLRKEHLGRAHHQYVVPREPSCWPTLVVNRPPVPSDALAAEGERDDRRRTSVRRAEVLEVRRTFVVSRLSAAYLASAYAQVVPRRRRRMGHTEVHEAPFAEATETHAVGEGRGIRDV
jgi:hypothetical protein